VESVRPLVRRVRQRSSYFNAVSADVSAADLEGLLDVPGISEIDLVRTYRRPAEPEPEVSAAPRLRGPPVPGASIYGDSFNQMYMIESVDLLEMGYNGSGDSSSAGQVMIGVLDTGFLLDHYAFDRLQVHAQWDFINDDPVTENEPGDNIYQDRHGTLVLGTIAGYAEGHLVGPAWGAVYLLAKTEIYGQEIEIEEDYWVAGLEWCDSIGADIVTSSLGYLDWYEEYELDGQTALCTRAASRAVTRGIVVCNAVGNYGYNGLTSLITPADADSVIAVGGVYADGTRWGSSSLGPTADGRIKPDVMAQAVGVQTVAWPTDYAFADNYSGTSFATPLVAGVCAQLIEIHPDWTPMQLKDSLLAHATNAAEPDYYNGYGIVKALLASGLAQDGPGGATISNGYPNPFNDRVSFDLYSGRWTQVTARVYDVTGRLVRTFLDEEPLIFSATVSWDGRNEMGTDVASGVYFVEFISPQVKSVVKVVRIR
jgi:hypothetical protein